MRDGQEEVSIMTHKENEAVPQLSNRKNPSIIKSINSLKLKSPEHVIEIYRQLQKEASLAIAIERQGRRKMYRYEIR